MIRRRQLATLARAVAASLAAATLLVVTTARAQSPTVPDGMRFILTGAIEEFDGVAANPSLTAVPVARTDEGGWSYAGDLDAALQARPSDRPNAACLIQFGARVGATGLGEDPDPTVVFSAVIPGGLRPGELYPVVATPGPPAEGSWGLYGREWANPGAFLVRVADLAPSDAGPVYTVWHGSEGTVRALTVTPERIELAFSARLEEAVMASDAADAPAPRALQLAGTFAQDHRSEPIAVAASVEALAGEATGDWYLCPVAPTLRAGADAADEADAEAIEAAAPLPDRAPAPAPQEPAAEGADTELPVSPGASRPASDAAAPADAAADLPAPLAADASIPNVCAGMPRSVWAGLVSVDAVNLVVEERRGACRISFDRPDPGSDDRWWRSAGVSHVAIPGQNGLTRLVVFGDGFDGEGRLEPGAPQRVVWTVEAD